MTGNTSGSAINFTKTVTTGENFSSTKHAFTSLFKTPNSVEVKLSTNGIFTLKLDEVNDAYLKETTWYLAPSATVTPGLKIYIVWDFYTADESIGIKMWEKNYNASVYLLYANQDGSIMMDDTTYDHSNYFAYDMTLKQGWNTIINEKKPKGTGTIEKQYTGVPDSSYKWKLSPDSTLGTTVDKTYPAAPGSANPTTAINFLYAATTNSTFTSLAELCGSGAKVSIATNGSFTLKLPPVLTTKLQTPQQQIPSTDSSSVSSSPSDLKIFIVQGFTTTNTDDYRLILLEKDSNNVFFIYANKDGSITGNIQAGWQTGTVTMNLKQGWNTAIMNETSNSFSLKSGEPDSSYKWIMYSSS